MLIECKWKNVLQKGVQKCLFLKDGYAIPNCFFFSMIGT